MGNQSVAYKDILSCHNDTDQCYQPFVQIIDGVNCLSIILNILHLVVLNQMKEIKTTKYFFILVNFSISDIIFSISSILYYNCEVREAILQLHAPASYWISKLTFAGIGGGAVLRFLAFLLSSFEKYIGVCQPYQYSTHFFINNFKWLTALVNTIGLLSLFGFGLIPEIEFCWTSLTIQIIPTTLEYKVLYTWFAVQNLSLSILISVILVKVWRELKVMIRRNLFEDKLMISASKYIIWSYVVYQLNLVFVVIVLICQTLNFISTLAITVEALSAILLSMYGSVNICMFIYFHPKYIDHVKSILRLVTRSHRVIRPGDIN